MRLSTNFGYFIRQMPGIPTEEWADRSKAVLDHHFDDHSHCGQFCQRKVALANITESTAEDIKKKFYRCKTQDAKLYASLKAIVDDFITPSSRLKEVGHGLDTQVNESLNNTVAWKEAPKNKVYSRSMSLVNRVSMACCTHLIGPKAFFNNRFEKLGVKMRHGTSHYLDLLATALQRRQSKQKLPETKRRRNEYNFEKLKK